MKTQTQRALAAVAGCGNTTSAFARPRAATAPTTLTTLTTGHGFCLHRPDENPGGVVVPRDRNLLYDARESARSLQPGAVPGNPAICQHNDDHDNTERSRRDHLAAWESLRGRQTSSFVGGSLISGLFVFPLIKAEGTAACQHCQGRRSSYPKGRFAFIRAKSVSWTRPLLANCRFFFAFLAESKCRRDACARSTLPVAVTLKRLATDLRVLLRAIGLGMSRAM